MELRNVNSERDEQGGWAGKPREEKAMLGGCLHHRRLNSGATSLRHDKKQGMAHLLEDCGRDEIN